MSKCRGCGQMCSDIERLSENNRQLSERLKTAESELTEAKAKNERLSRDIKAAQLRKNGYCWVAREKA